MEENVSGFFSEHSVQNFHNIIMKLYIAQQNTTNQTPFSFAFSCSSMNFFSNIHSSFKNFVLQKHATQCSNRMRLNYILQRRAPYQEMVFLWKFTYYYFFSLYYYSG